MIKPSLSLMVGLLLMLCVSAYGQKVGVLLASPSPEVNRELERLICNNNPDWVCQTLMKSDVTSKYSTGIVQTLAFKGKLESVVVVNSSELSVNSVVFYSSAILVVDSNLRFRKLENYVDPTLKSLADGIHDLFKPSLREAAKR